ncbi:lysophospholipid acyltransferase family protein [Thiorhodococcus minor]|uniref:1-acyl-sn-glycerol-3-phosphate acyltransferase n=1 Tax=Thiorhodococcus minor TaxID=57489 RepID=A0A6M0JZB3_9GAMM|nr:lysophospholipid acyltransferase family protein [Thiorhodococcus minor]NEV62003.1 1-acyl-sn-glycerol-3-phosphate acyltransferase [Thiorhodococcus minor]
MIARVTYRGLRVAEHLITGAVIAAYVRARYGRAERPPAWLPAAVRWWHARLCRALGIEIEVRGRLAHGCLLVGNHISWLDIPAIGAQDNIGFLSKSDVRHWPLIGWMAEIAGTRFIERGGNQSSQVFDHLRSDLMRGRAVMIFPEGTTTDGDSVKRFHPRLLAAAQAPDLGIQPVAISYHRGDDPAPDQDAPYVGEDSLAANLWRLLRHPNLIAKIRFLPPIRDTQGEQRRALAERTRAAVLEALDLPQYQRAKPPITDEALQPDARRPAPSQVCVS